MKKILLVFSVLFLFSMTACDDDCPFCIPASFCDIDDVREEVADSACLAEDILTNFDCPNLRCSSRNPDIRIGDSDTCTIIDCETISCEKLTIETFNPETSMIVTESAPGLITEISVNEETGFPTGFFEVDDLVGELSCVLFFP